MLDAHNHPVWLYEMDESADMALFAPMLVLKSASLYHLRQAFTSPAPSLFSNATARLPPAAHFWRPVETLHARHQRHCMVVSAAASSATGHNTPEMEPRVLPL